MNLQAIKQRFGIIGRSNKLDHALSTAIRVASTDLTVLISGESGVGKENIAKIIHSLSARKHNSIIAINCGAIPEGTINSELFGHEKGAFTGATSDRKGYFETADGGTIFLDEIGEMPLDTQAYLLRVLESGEFIKVGSSKVLKTDVRVIAATNQQLLDRINQGKFREDLYYRLNTVPISVPPLRERREDIWMLFRKFSIDISERYKMDPIELTSEARILLENYSWPGNIRELKNIAEQISILSEERIIDVDKLTSFLPNIGKRNLPAVHQAPSQTSFEEREILYKLLFDMKSDLNDLKSVVKGLIKDNDLTYHNRSALEPSELSDYEFSEIEEDYRDQQIAPLERVSYSTASEEDDHAPILIKSTAEEYADSEIVEENLSLEEMEKEFIQKALSKHNGRRKEAAKDLGISERTLYRKIKEYELN